MISEPEVYDVLGVGCGPANLALGVALHEEAESGGRNLRRLFLDRKPRFIWHPGMLLEDSLIQISVLKDLVTVHNPRSHFTFLNYLKSQDRLFSFLNVRSLFPTRLEFNDYLTWVANGLGDHLRFGRTVETIEPEVLEDGRVEVLRVRARTATGRVESYRTRHLVLAAGGIPSLPEGIEVRAGGRAFHSHRFLQRSEELFPDREAPYRFVVVGSGQSAAEIFLHLFQTYPRAQVTGTIRRFAYRPVDESDFKNEIFFPSNVDRYYNLPPDKRRELFRELKDVNYAVIDHDLIQRIYRALYRQRLKGPERGRIEPFMHLREVHEEGDQVVAHFESTMGGEDRRLEADGLVLCTGYEWPKEHPALASLGPYFERDDLGGYRVERDYRIAAAPGFEPRVYLQGYCEDTHGISETVLSLLPIRAQDILRSLVPACDRRPASLPSMMAVP